MELKGAVAIVTGASRGLGVYIAEALARKGADIALAARSADDLEATAARVEAFGVRTITVPTDVTKRSDLRGLVKRTTTELGPPDVLINNAGIENLSRFQEMPLDDIDAVLKTNVIALEVLTRLVVPAMVERGGGHVANIASLAGKTAAPFNTVYSSSKHAVVGFSWSLREELKPHGVGVSVICPTYVSEAGMFATSSTEDPPKISSTVTPVQVADATIKAIERNRAEIVVAPGLSKFVDVVHAISPEITTQLARRTGAYDFLSRHAAKAAEAATRRGRDEGSGR
ncbi:MAG: SDR family NAD(P)-dependent oxidoreductase [Actinomycetota bacterium]|nr:SDR family NAD(P)-dependent oxidoreductase [Actinomycetota bacterium]